MDLHCDAMLHGLANLRLKMEMKAWRHGHGSEFGVFRAGGVYGELCRKLLRGLAILSEPWWQTPEMGQAGFSFGAHQRRGETQTWQGPKKPVRSRRESILASGAFALGTWGPSKTA